MNELKIRGLTDILIAVVDGLKGFPEAIYRAADAKTALQRLDELETKWSKRHPTIAPTWRRAWEYVVPCSASHRRSGR